MPTKIGFWNVEHWSNNALLKAEEAEEQATFALERIQRGAVQRGHNTKPTRAVTRLQLRNDWKKHKFSGLSRAEKSELNALKYAKGKLRIAQQKVRKYTYARDMVYSCDHLFYCEVESSHTDAQSSSANGIISPHLLCYAYYHDKVSTALNHYAHWPAPIANLQRVPKYRDIAGSGQGGIVRCYFWHAPSGNNGTIVATAYNHLVGLHNNLGTPFVLFGDINTEPTNLILKGIPAGNIVATDGGTRISTRILDFAITNVPNRISIRKYQNCPAQSIKDQNGSDHAFMFLEIT